MCYIKDPQRVQEYQLLVPVGSLFFFLLSGRHMVLAWDVLKVFSAPSTGEIITVTNQTLVTQKFHLGVNIENTPVP